MEAQTSGDVSSNVIVCIEQPNRWYGQMFRRHPPYFDPTVPMNHIGLTNILGSSVGWGAQEVEQKFSEANQKLKKGFINPFCFIMLVLGFAIVHLTINSTKTEALLICLTDKVCNWTDNDTRLWCPKIPKADSWATGCCYALCSFDVGAQEKCIPDESSNEKVKQNLAVWKGMGRMICQCKTEEETEQCGELKLYGEKRYDPGTEHIVGPISIVFMILTGVFCLFFCVYTLWRNIQVKRILKDNFHDWNEKGIRVEYYAPRKYAPGHITLTLPPSVPQSSQSVLPEKLFFI